MRCLPFVLLAVVSSVALAQENDEVDTTVAVPA